MKSMFFWLKKTKEERYSEKLETLFKSSAQVIAEFPELGGSHRYSKPKAKNCQRIQDVLCCDGIKKSNCAGLGFAARS